MISRALTTAGAVMLVAGFVWLWWQAVPALYRTAGGGSDAANARLSAVTTTRAALLVGFVGLGALGTFWLNSRVYRITERGQVTDRYSKAIEQLGSPTLDVRLGGIYALEQIAKDSARGEEDQRTIVEVLSAFVRVHSDPIYQYKASGPAANDRTEANDDELAETAATYVAKRTKPPVDVQAAVTVLGRLPLHRAVPRGDFTEAYLAHIRLDVGANLTGARLNEANLTGAQLYRADLTEGLPPRSGPERR